MIIDEFWKTAKFKKVKPFKNVDMPQPKKAGKQLKKTEVAKTLKADNISKGKAPKFKQQDNKF